MKRPALHLLFWVVYLFQDTLLHYTWMAPLIKDVPDNRQYWLAVLTALVLLPPKLMVVYYFINRGVKRILNERKKWIYPAAEMGSFLVTSVLLFRITYYYLINPFIYQMEFHTALFNARSILIAILEIGYITGIAITLKLLRLQISSKEREQNLVKEKLQTELKFLKNQTNPHFLFNTLNNIYALARKKSDKTPEVVMKLSELLSFILYESGKETITVAEEIKMLEDYIDLEKIRYSERLSVNVHKDIDNGSQKIMPLIMLPLIENAFKHGASETRFDSFINVGIKLDKGHLFYSIENSFENGKTRKSDNSIGLNNIRRQLELMYKEHEMKVHNDENIFKVNVSINLDSYGKI